MKLKEMVIGAPVAFLVALLLLAPLARAADDQSLSAAAKEKSGTKAKHVYTDDDLPSTRADTSSSSSVDAADNQQGDGKEDKDKKDTAEPASKSDTQKELESVKHDKELLKKKLSDLQEKADKATDPFRKRMYEDAVVNQQTTLADFEKQQRDLEKQVAEQKDKAEK